MDSNEIAKKLEILIRQERELTREILELIEVCLEKRTYLEFGFSSMFDWLTRGFGYSNAAAQRRIETARLLKSVPLAKEKLSEGKVNLSTLSKVQTVIRQQEKISGTKVSLAQKVAVVGLIEEKSTVEAEKVLVSFFPETASTIHQERRTVINEDLIRYQMNLNSEASENLQRAKEVLSHKLPFASDAEVVAYALEFLLSKLDPIRRDENSSKPQKNNLEKGELRASSKYLVTKSTAHNELNETEEPKANSTSAAEVNSSENALWDQSSKLVKASKARQRGQVISKAEDKCTFEGRNGQVCGSRYQTELDHIIPKALGGSDHPSNLRVLCRQHNLLMAERVFGKRMIDPFRHH